MIGDIKDLEMKSRLTGGNVLCTSRVHYDSDDCVGMSHSTCELFWSGCVVLLRSVVEELHEHNIHQMPRGFTYSSCLGIVGDGDYTQLWLESWVGFNLRHRNRSLKL